ncbi:hypothetical protein MSPP1_002104 [Malassezia sp. CBS 17886]|nr:hypothetical protein MSPP1_002104 [Malassezia sp. CBS 17886]
MAADPAATSAASPVPDGDGDESGAATAGSTLPAAAPLSRQTSTARLEAVAKLRRAASHREIRRVSPRHFRVHAQPAAPAAPASPAASASPAPAAPAMLADWGLSGAVYPTSPAVPVNRAERVPLPSLDALRRRILQERTRPSLSRSASTSGASQAVRAYTMQKLMGATTPVPYNDMFDLVRGVNETRFHADDGDAPGAADAIARAPAEPARQGLDATALHVEEPSDAPRTVAADAPGSPAHDGRSPPKRATLMRSVSARDFARMNMFQKLLPRGEGGTASPRTGGGARRGGSLRAEPERAPAASVRTAPAPPAAVPPAGGQTAGMSLAPGGPPRTPETPADVPGRWPRPDDLALAPCDREPLWGAPQASRAPIGAGCVDALPTSESLSAAQERAAPPEGAGAQNAQHALPEVHVSQWEACGGLRNPVHGRGDWDRTAARSARVVAPAVRERFAGAEAAGGRPSWATPARHRLGGSTPDAAATAQAAGGYTVQYVTPDVRGDAGVRALPEAGASPSWPTARATPPSPREEEQAHGTRLLDEEKQARGTRPLHEKPTHGGYLPPIVSEISSEVDAEAREARARRMRTRAGSASQTTGPEAPRDATPKGEKPLPKLPGIAGAREEGEGGGKTWMARSVNGMLLRPGGMQRSASHTLFAHSAGTEAHAAGSDDDAACADGAPRREARGARLFGSLRRKASRTLFDRPRARETAEGAGAPGGAAGAGGAGRAAGAGVAAGSDGAAGAGLPTDATNAALVTLEGEAAVPGAYMRTVVLPVTPAALVRWNQTLTSPLQNVLALFPRVVRCAVVQDPPRGVRRVLSVLQAAGGDFVKLRTLFVFDDVLVLAKSSAAPTAQESLSDYMVRKLATAPDMQDVYTVLDVVDLRYAQLSATQARPRDERAELHALMLRYLPQLHDDVGATLDTIATDAALGCTDYVRARLLFVCPELDRDTLSHYLYTHRAVLEQYVAQHRFAGISLEAALRMLLLDLRFPAQHTDFAALLATATTHWMRCNRARLPDAFTPAVAMELAFALMELNDALHAESGPVPGVFAHAQPHLSLEQFVASFRAHDPQHVVSLRDLGEMYLAMKAHPLDQACAAGDPAPRSVYVAGRALAEPLVTGIPSPPIYVSLDRPDADLRICLAGADLFFDPPVLTFAHRASAEFTVCSTARGARDMLFLRTGRHARLYRGAGSRPGWQPLPRHIAMHCDARASRSTVALMCQPPDQPAQSLAFFLADAAAALAAGDMIRQSIDVAAANSRRFTPLELDARAVSLRALENQLFADEGGSGVRTPTSAHASTARHASPGEGASRAGRSGQELVRAVRENSLLHLVLSEAGSV